MYQLPDTLVLASNNTGKLDEFKDLFTRANLNSKILPQSDFNVPDADETGLSFIENAILKARHASRISGHAAMADDSGLAIPALGGAPGIYSARYASLSGAGKHGDDAANNAKLLEDLTSHRSNAPIDAYFVCILALVKHENDPLPIIAQGLWHGEILETPRGENGFGYDPLFWLAELDASSAELTKAKKNQISHRALAMHSLLAQLSS